VHEPDTAPTPSADPQGHAAEADDGGALPARTAPGGAVVLAATPIGNLGDASRRLVELLAEADLIAAEDTRRLQRLVSGLGVRPRGRVVSYHEHNEAAKTPELVEAVRAGGTVLLVTDAGMPAVSDPGYRLVEAAVSEGLTVTALPGPSAVLTALALSGLPTDRFCFEGFLPRKAGERSQRLSELRGERRTMVFFEAPHRLGAMLAAVAEAFGAERRVAVCRELTKTYEEVLRGGAGELAAWAAAGEVRGEIAVVIEGAPEAPPASIEDLVGEVQALVAAGTRLKEAVAVVAEEAGASKRELYAAAVAAK
jgi:16S rRNA (cytidine1402-2'-O)-methyltransferase